MDDNTNPSSTPAPKQQPSTQDEQQPAAEEKAGLLPGQEHEDELDFMGAALFSIAKNAFSSVKNFLNL